MRGYFGIGVEGISKVINVGNLFRSAHAFGASFTFTVGAALAVQEARADTSRALGHMPYYEFNGLDDFLMPKGCQLVGIELTEDAVDLPSFHHPSSAVYLLGREKGSISPEMLGLCDHIVKIPTSFCINVAMAGAIVMYDRHVSMGRYPARPLMPGGPKDLGPPENWTAPAAGSDS